MSAAQPFGCLARLPKLSLFPSAQQRSLPGAAECTIDSSGSIGIDGQLIGFFVALAAKANPGMASFLQLFAPPPDACGEEAEIINRMQAVARGAIPLEKHACFTAREFPKNKTGFTNQAQLFYCIDQFVPARSNADRQLHATQTALIIAAALESLQATCFQ